MGRPRAFDWDEAAQLYRALGTYAAVGRELGVTGVSVRRALNPTLQRKQSRDQKQRRAWVGACTDCGGPATRRQATSGDKSRNGRCKTCAARAAAQSVRPDTLRCCCCRLWLADENFPQRKAAIARRGRHAICTPCGRVAKADHRSAHPEQELAAYLRRKAKRQAARMAAAST